MFNLDEGKKKRRHLKHLKPFHEKKKYIYKEDSVLTNIESTLVKKTKTRELRI